MENLLAKLTAFSYSLDNKIKKLEALTEPLPRFQFMTDSMASFCKEVIEIGDFSEQKLTDFPKKPQSLPYYFINFSWIEYAKSFLILWRNVLFEEGKAQIFLAEKRVEKNDLVKLQNASQTSLSDAANELKNHFENGTEAIKRAKGGAKKQVEKWALQSNPQTTYRKQLEMLPAQCNDLLEQFEFLENQANGFGNIRHLIIEGIVNCGKDLKDIIAKANKSIIYIEENLENNFGKIPSHLEDVEEGLNVPSYNDLMVAELNKFFQGLSEKSNLIVAAEAGVLQQREINIKRNVRQWLDAEILPQLYEVWELADGIGYGLKMSVANIRNRVLLLTADSVEKSQAEQELCQPLYNFIEKVNNQQVSLKQLNATIQKRLDENFFVSSVFNLNRDFLPVPLQSALNQYRLEENKWFLALQEWLNKQSRYISMVRATVEKEETLSTSEKVARFVQNRTLQDLHSSYSSIFLTTGHIGESFWVGRSQHLNHFKNIMNQWEAGFRGAVVVTGKRFAGKTFFGDHAANHFFHNNYIRLLPNSTLNLAGRKFQTTYDLGEALQFIQKNAVHSKPMIWLDDLEIWSSPELPLGQNIRQLKYFIDRYASRMFFMVSMGNWTKAHLGKMYDLNTVFQAEINLDTMPAAEIQEAILIRHGATHKHLVDDEGKEATPPYFKKIVTDTLKRSGGNIGESLRTWAVAIRYVDDEKVRYRSNAAYAFPDFLNPDTAILLTTLMIEKRTNEYRLRKLFGSAFKNKYTHLVQRLIGIGILYRNVDGWLEINSAVVNEVGELLERRNYLTYRKS